jgi:hypothetical protein
MSKRISCRLLLPLFCLSFLFASCKKELDEVEIDPIPTWEAHNQFLHSNRFISNLYASNGKLQIMSMNLFSTIENAGEQGDVKHYIHYFRNISHHKHPMNARIFTGADQNYIYFKSVSDPVLSGVHLTLNAKELDPQFVEFRLALTHTGESFALSENNVALVPYTYFVEEKGIHALRYFLVKMELDSNTWNNDRIVLKEVRILTPEQEGGYVRHMRSHQNDFLVTTDWGFYRISEDGEISFQLPYQIASSTFEHKGDLYAVSRHGRQQTHALLKSITPHNWAIDANLGSQAEMLQYHAITDEMILASYNSQIFELELGAGNFVLRELDNTGLEGHAITSIARLNDKIYIATRSGLFSKAAEHLLTYKEEAK